MNDQQLDLCLEAKATARHPRHAELVAALADGEWRTAALLRAAGFGDRELREIVEADEEGDFLSFPGSPGYKLFARATLEEIRRADALKNQGDAMTSRWLRYQRRLHRRGLPQ